MGKNEIIFDVRINICDEVAESCIAALNNWLKDGNRRLELCEKENGAQFLIETD